MATKIRMTLSDLRHEASKLKERIEASLALGVIYNPESTEVRNRTNWLLEKMHRETVKQSWLDCEGLEDSPQAKALYFMDPRPHNWHLWAKKVDEAIDAHPKHPMAAAARVFNHHAEDLVFVAKMLKAGTASGKVELRRGRKPSDDPTKTPARTLENTGTCAVCGQNVKLDAGSQCVDHGYRVIHNTQTRGCIGVGKKPIELSPEGIQSLIIGLVGLLEEEASKGPQESKNDELRRQDQLSHLEQEIAQQASRIAKWEARPLPGEKQ